MKRKANSNYRPGYHRKEAGVTLVELMVGVVVGLIVLSGVLYTFLVTYIGSKDVLNSTRLNEETSAILELMTGEVRRSGHWYVSAASAAAMSNPFIDDGEIDIAINVGGEDCVLYRYDRNGDGNVASAAEFLGFKLEDDGGVGVIKFRKSGDTMASCAADSDNSWESVTDTDFMNVTDLTLTDQTVCALGEGASSVAVCGVTSDDYVLVREVMISITAEVNRDPDWSTTLSDTVRIRNDFVENF